MDDYLDAYTQDELDKAKVIPGSSHLQFNHRPLDIYKKESFWKNRGFDWAKITDGRGALGYMDNVVEYCKRAEKKNNFAKECRKNRGFFKCIAFQASLIQFHEIDWELKRMGLWDL